MTLSRRHALWAFFVIQVACTLFFLRDSFGDVMGLPDSHETTANLIELAVSFCLIVGLAITGWELKRLSHREERLQNQVSVASGAFADILQREFDSWGLTEAEQGVALLGIKGYSIAEMASLRNTKEGTIKAQNASVYRKAGVSGRLQLLSHFVEDLIDEDLIGNRPSPAS